jgi:steroid delta-isomerase-like uncharacterized protein
MSANDRDLFAMPRLTRRSALTAGTVSLAAAFGLTARSGAARQDDLPEVIAAHLAAWEALDADRIAGNYAEDAVYEDVALGVTAEGRDAIHAFVSSFLTPFSDGTYTIASAFASEDQAAVAWTFAANYTGMMEGLPPGTGQPIVLRGATLIEFAGGEIRKSTDYFDSFGFLIQVGVIPPLGAEGTPAATPAR